MADDVPNIHSKGGKFYLPGLTDRTAILGQTGSGKTVFATWLLSESAFDKQPWIIFDYKGDDLLSRIDRAREIGLGTIPKQPGIYLVRPRPDQDKEVEDYLWKIWARERVGLFFDETTLLPKHYSAGAVRSIFVQGRSKRIPVIACSQRPRGVSPYLFSEAGFFAAFYLQKPDDVVSFAEYTPWTAKQIMANPLENHWCRWFDQKRRFHAVLRPSPTEDEILETFERRLKPKRYFL
jgi:DNA helicase HerA-like ATPase